MNQNKSTSWQKKLQASTSTGSNKSIDRGEYTQLYDSDSSKSSSYIRDTRSLEEKKEYNQKIIKYYCHIMSNTEYLNTDEQAELSRYKYITDKLQGTSTYSSLLFSGFVEKLRRDKGDMLGTPAIEDAWHTIQKRKLPINNISATIDRYIENTEKLLQKNQISISSELITDFKTNHLSIVDRQSALSKKIKDAKSYEDLQEIKSDYTKLANESKELQKKVYEHIQGANLIQFEDDEQIDSNLTADIEKDASRYLADIEHQEVKNEKDHVAIIEVWSEIQDRKNGFDSTVKIADERLKNSIEWVQEQPKILPDAKPEEQTLYTSALEWHGKAHNEALVVQENLKNQIEKAQNYSQQIVLHDQYSRLSNNVESAQFLMLKYLDPKFHSSVMPKSEEITTLVTAADSKIKQLQAITNKGGNTEDKALKLNINAAIRAAKKLWPECTASIRLATRVERSDDAAKRDHIQTLLGHAQKLQEQNRDLDDLLELMPILSLINSCS